MSKFLIHIHSGPELKNKATLGMLVAITAHKKGNQINIFWLATEHICYTQRMKVNLLVKEQEI